MIVVCVWLSSRKLGATACVPLSAWRVLRAARHAEQRLGGWRRPTLANERRSSPEKVNDPPQSRQIRTLSISGMVESFQPVGGVSLAGFAQQLLSRVPLPRVRQVGTRRRPHVDV